MLLWPRQVLHKLLDDKEGNVAVVAISNWNLDPAKMNRMVPVFRPPPSPEDLAETALSIAKPNTELRARLRGIAKAYAMVYDRQTKVGVARQGQWECVLTWYMLPTA